MQCKILGQYLVQAAFSENNEDHGFLFCFFKQAFWLWNPSALSNTSNRIMWHVQAFPSDFLLSTALGFTLCMTSKQSPWSDSFIYSSWGLLFLKANSLMVSLHSTVDLVCFDLPVTRCPNLCDHNDNTTATTSFKAYLHPSFITAISRFPHVSLAYEHAAVQKRNHLKRSF